MSFWKKVETHEVICMAGENSQSLYIIHEGKLVILLTKGSKVTPVAYLGPGEYLGELSFFDAEPRSAHVVALEETSLIKIPRSELHKQFPPWLKTIATAITQKIRHADELIKARGIRRQNVESIKPLSICLLYTSPSPRDATLSRMPSSA